MGQSIYFADPAVAEAYHVHPGEWAYVGDDAEAAWLLEQHHGYALEQWTPVPAAYFVHPDAPLPFVAYPGPAPAPAPTPAPSPAPAPAPTPIPPSPAPTPPARRPAA